MAARPGFEPGLGESKSPVLPLHHQARKLKEQPRSLRVKGGIDPGINKHQGIGSRLVPLRKSRISPHMRLPLSALLVACIFVLSGGKACRADSNVLPTTVWKLDNLNKLGSESLTVLGK